MVQEDMSYDSGPTMFSRHPHPHQTSYGMNLPHFGYQQNIAYHGQDFGQFPMGDGSLQQTGLGGTSVGGGVTSAGTGWTNSMYGTSPPIAPTTGGRPNSSPTGMEDCWGNTFTSTQNMAIGTSHATHSPSAGAGTTNPYPYRTGLAGTQNSLQLSAELSPYTQPASHSPPVPPTNMHMTQSPSPTAAMMGSVAPGGSAVGHPVRQTARQPYDWMKKQSYPPAPNPGGPPTRKTRTKDKYRIVYSEYQKVELEKEYLYSKYITIQRKAELSRSIGLSERQVKIWFQNRRAKERKQKRKREESISNTSGEIQDIKNEMSTSQAGDIKTETMDVHSHMSIAPQPMGIQHH